MCELKREETSDVAFQRPSFTLNATKITWFSVLRIERKKERKGKEEKRKKEKKRKENLCSFEVRASYVK